VPTTLRRAFNEARTPPTGPTFVAFSANALDDEGDMDIYPPGQGYFRTAPDAAAVQAAADILAGAERPVILVGDRISQSGAAPEAVRLAELTGASVYSSSYSEMNFPSTHPQYLGGIKIGYPESMGVLGAADAVLAIGKLSTVYYMFSDPAMRFFGPDTKLIHMDQDGNRVGSSQPTDVGIIADPKTGLDMLADAVEATMSGSAREAAKGRADDAASMKADMDEAAASRLKSRWDMNPMSADRMMAEIAKVLPSDSIIINDAVTSGTALLNSFDFTEPGSIYGGRGGALGWGMGGAMGVKLAQPDRPVVAIDGDGSAMMTVQGLWTAANDGIPVVYVVCNNSEYRILKLNMDIYKDIVLKQPGAESQYMGMNFPVRPNFAQIAEAMGVHSRRVDDPAQVGPAMIEALSLGKPALLDIIIGNQ
jgi:benzoylformate decarboxylase